ncbi:MAG: 4Fe-4S binding protein [bacterium]
MAVIGLSILSVQWWGSKSEELVLPEIQIDSETETIADIARVNEIPLVIVLTALGIDSVNAEITNLVALNLTTGEVEAKITKTLITYYEHQSKNWLMIFLKFLLWGLLLPIPVIIIARRKMTPGRRRLIYLISLVTFGIFLGSDPSPMGTVKDAVFLMTAHQTIFWPRIIALGLFLITVVLSTKLICSWGCQFGTLQDILFRFGRNKKDRKGKIRQFKPPFWISNSIRVLFFLASILVGLVWSLDIVGLIDPFRVYKPLVLSVGGALFLAIVLVASLIVYRPWCHFACPFGLVSWLFEKLAIFRIRIDYGKCDACQVCNSACPSTVMDAILKQDRVLPDCFGCGVCVESCPTKAISITSSRKQTGDYTIALQTLQTKRETLKNRRSK